MKMNEIVTEADDADLDNRLKTFFKNREKRAAIQKSGGFKAGWAQGQRIAHKMTHNPVVSTLQKIDRWANRPTK